MQVGRAWIEIHIQFSHCGQKDSKLWNATENLLGQFQGEAASGFSIYY